MTYRLNLMLLVLASSMGIYHFLTGGVLAATDSSSSYRNDHKASDTAWLSANLNFAKAAVLENGNLGSALVEPVSFEVKLIPPINLGIALRVKALPQSHLLKDDASAQTFLARRPPHGPPPPPPPPPPGRPPHGSPPPPPPPPPPPF